MEDTLFHNDEDELFALNADATTTGGPVTADEIAATMRKMDEALAETRRKIERANGELAAMRCPVCGRKGVVIGNSLLASTLLICRHIFDALKADPRTTVVETEPAGGWLLGMRIEVLDG